MAEMGVVLNREDRQMLNVDLFDEVTGLGPLEPLLKDDTVNDILVNGPTVSSWNAPGAGIDGCAVQG
jgi:pilus assembly protein CpaF